MLNRIQGGKKSMSVPQNCRNIKQAVCPDEKRSPNDRQLLLTTSVRLKWEESKSCQSPLVKMGG